MDRKKIDFYDLQDICRKARLATNENPKRGFIPNMEDVCKEHFNYKDCLIIDEYIYLWKDKTRGFYTYDADLRYDLTQDNVQYVKMNASSYTE